MNSLSFISAALAASWDMLLDAAVYMLFGISMAGLMKIFISTDYVARHLGRGRFSSVVKAALLGIPLPLCSCGVLPAAAGLKRQGASNGATTAFLPGFPIKTFGNDGRKEGGPEQSHASKEGHRGKLKGALVYSFSELWGDLAGWFFLGLLLAGVITTLLPAEMFNPSKSKNIQ